jgi:hypothetical protein
MPTLLQGTDGAFKVGPSGSESAIGYLTEVEVELDQEVKKQGPYIGNANISKVRGGKDAKGSAKGFMVTPRDAGQNAIRQAMTNGTDVRLLLEIGPSGALTDTVTVPTAIITNVKFGQKADEGVPISFDWEASGGYTWT